MPSFSRRLAAIVASLGASGFVLGVLLVGLAAPAQAANIVVNPCTVANLRAAIISATASTGGLVTFACPGGAHTFTVTGTQSLSRAVTIDGGGVITISGGDTDRIFSVPDSEKATLLNLTLAHGSAAQGGALSVAGLAVITNVTFISNAATIGGALAVFTQGRADISLSHFISNTATKGGAIASTGHLTIDQSDFTGNSAPNGGAISQGGVASVSGSTFTGNLGQFGGAINSVSGLTLVGDEFDHNATPLSLPAIGPQGGGALYVNAGAIAMVQQTTFFSNSANIGGVGGMGGAIVNRGTLFVFDSLFNQNHALQDGGAVFNDSVIELRQSTLMRNSALGEGGAISTTSTALLFNSTVASNTAEVSGGALADAGSALLEYTLLFNNSAPSGGGVRIHTNHNASIVGVTFYSNTATSGAGGAILANGDVLAVSSTFVANDAAASGGAIQASGTNTPTVILENDTIVSNTAASAGAALRRLDGSLNLANSLVAFNSPDNCQGAITKQGNNIQFGSLSCGVGITNTNPLLGPLQDNGGARVGVFHVGLPTLRPSAGSPAIDGGDDTYCSVFNTDERGYLRAPPCDLGAIEAYLKLWLPLVHK